jgi:hypothetical protein
VNDLAAPSHRHRELLLRLAIVLLVIVAITAIIVVLAATLGADEQGPHDMENMIGVVERT